MGDTREDPRASESVADGANEHDSRAPETSSLMEVLLVYGSRRFALDIAALDWATDRAIDRMMTMGPKLMVVSGGAEGADTAAIFASMYVPEKKPRVLVLRADGMAVASWKMAPWPWWHELAPAFDRLPHAQRPLARNRAMANLLAGFRAKGHRVEALCLVHPDSTTRGTDSESKLLNERGITARIETYGREPR